MTSITFSMMWVNMRHLGLSIFAIKMSHMAEGKSSHENDICRHCCRGLLTLENQEKCDLLWMKCSCWDGHTHTHTHIQGYTHIIFSCDRIMGASKNNRVTLNSFRQKVMSESAPTWKESNSSGCKDISVYIIFMWSVTGVHPRQTF